MMPTFSLRRRSMALTMAAGLILATVCSPAQDLASLASGASNDLQKALAELTSARQAVEAERLPLARRLTELEQKLSARRGEYAKAQRFQENQLVELNALKAQAKGRADEVKFIESLLAEYARAFRSRIHFVEETRYAPRFDAAEKAAAQPDLPPDERFARRAELLSTSLQRSEQLLGGEIFDGKALDTEGRVQPGKVALIGPVAMFAESSGKAAGLLQQELNKADLSVMSIDKEVQAGSLALATKGTGQLALDPTLGNAFKLAAMDESLYEKLAQGGLIMIPLLGLGLAALIVGIVKWLQLSRIHLASERDLQTVLKHLDDGQQEHALRTARNILGPAGELLTAAVEHFGEKKEYIEEVIYEKMLGARTRLERGIPFLALTATTGPLMGLLGTVMGMIATFRMISSFGSGDPKQLAAGISEALICTATGMAVAIPSLLFHAFLSRKAKGIIGSMEQTAVGFINGIPESRDQTFA
jgi:biopolymer transport protein ExbB